MKRPKLGHCAREWRTLMTTQVIAGPEPRYKVSSRFISLAKLLKQLYQNVFPDPDATIKFR